LPFQILDITFNYRSEIVIEINCIIDFYIENEIHTGVLVASNINEMLDRLEGTKYFSLIDLGNANSQVLLEESSKIKTAVSTKSCQYCFNRMPFGIAAAPGTFQGLMGKILDSTRGTLIYLDDIIIFTESKHQHYKVLDEVLGKVDKQV